MYVPHKDEIGKRRYGRWAGNPRGLAENITRCAVEVYCSYTAIPGQCERKRGHGPDGEYCKQHAAKVEQP